LHHHYQSPGLTAYLAKYGITIPQYAREPLTRTKWTPAIAIEGLQKHGIDLAYTSAATYYTRTARLTKAGAPLYSGDTMRSLARETNEYGARVVADSNGHFRLFAVLPQTDIDGSLREIEYAIDTLKAPGFCMGTSVGVTYLGDKKLEPILEELNRRRAVVYTHPNEADWALDLVPGVSAAAVWYGNDTTVAIWSLLSSDAPKKFPNIRWIMSHAGGTLPYMVQRVVGEPVKPKLTGTPKPGERLYYLRNNFYYDTAQSANAAAMPALKVVAGVSQILFGTDYPWSTIDVDVEGMTDAGVFTPGELTAIYRENALRLLPL
jgi:predicted TIM-barrel fold metal-dependent hydrolase